MATDMDIRQDTLMAHYMSSHVAVAYGYIFEELAALSQAPGPKVRVLAGWTPRAGLGGAARREKPG
jgi:hypothetical protein